MSAIDLRGVSKVFPAQPNDVVAVADVNLTVQEREFAAILGPSGCGKSTLLMMIAGLIGTSAGTVSVDSRLVRGPVTDVGIVFQRDLLFDWRTVLGNIMLQAEIRRMDRAAALQKAHALISMVGLEGFENAHPWQLSGGMRQRVSICRALLHGAPLLLLDEPFGALDALTREELNLDLQRIWSNDRPTAVFITHDIGEAIFLADRVIVMAPRPGRVIADVTIELARPRPLAIRDSAEFVAYQHLIRRHIDATWGRR